MTLISQECCIELVWSELKELVEKQTEAIVNIQTNLEECNKNALLTQHKLKEAYEENIQLKEDIKCQNDKILILQEKQKNLTNDLMNQKVWVSQF